MTNRIRLLLVLVAICIGLCKAASLNTNEVEARTFVNQADKKLRSYFADLGHDLFIFDDGDIEDLNAAENFLKELKRIINGVGQVMNESKTFDYSKFKDVELKHIFELIMATGQEMILGEEKCLELIDAVAELNDLDKDKDVESYHNSTTDKMAYFPDIQNVFLKSHDTEELKYYWSTWRKKNNVWVKKHFRIIIETLKNAADLLGMTPLEFWLDRYNVTEMEEVMIQIQPLYRQLHTFIRNQLLKKYGPEVIKPNGPIPDHLFEQVLVQIWTNRSIIEDMYPRNDLPAHNSILAKNNYDARLLYKNADEFYQSLGFDPIPKETVDTQIKMRKRADEGDCRPMIPDFTPESYMLYCHKMDFGTFLKAHVHMGRLYYAREKKHLPTYYFSSYDLEYFMGEAVMLSASTPKHLKAIGLLTDFKFTDDVLMNQLLRASIQTLLSIPVHFVHVQLMADIFSGKVSLREINKHYWMLMKEHVGVEPPTDREPHLFDFPVKFYLDLSDNHHVLDFETAVRGYQIYKKLCEISGQYPNEPLQNCDFYGSKSVGDALKKMMRLGSSKPFQEVLATLLPEETKLNADSLLEYYRPIETWLAKKTLDADKKLDKQE